MFGILLFLPFINLWALGKLPTTLTLRIGAKLCKAGGLVCTIWHCSINEQPCEKPVVAKVSFTELRHLIRMWKGKVDLCHSPLVWRSEVLVILYKFSKFPILSIHHNLNKMYRFPGFSYFSFIQKHVWRSSYVQITKLNAVVSLKSKIHQLFNKYVLRTCTVCQTLQWAGWQKRSVLPENSYFREAKQ